MEILFTIYIIGAAICVGGALMLTLLLGMFTGTISWPVIGAGILYGLAWPLTILWGIIYSVYQAVRRK
jgi:hypothetical protein